MHVCGTSSSNDLGLLATTMMNRLLLGMMLLLLLFPSLGFPSLVGPRQCHCFDVHFEMGTVVQSGLGSISRAGDTARRKVIIVAHLVPFEKAMQLFVASF